VSVIPLLRAVAGTRVFFGAVMEGVLNGHASL